jgi:hypothetical protein
MPKQVLIACSDSAISHQLASIIAQGPQEPVLAFTVDQAQKILSNAAISLTLCEDQLPDGGYRKLLQEAALTDSNTPLVVLSRLDDPQQYVEAIEAGALDYIAPPYGRTKIESIINRRCEKRVDISLPVEVYGTNVNDVPFYQCARTRNISSQGALLEGIACELKPGIVIGVRCCDREANFRVIWVRETGSSPKTQEVGIQSLDRHNFIWTLLPAPLWRSEGDLAARSNWTRLVDTHLAYGSST